MQTIEGQLAQELRVRLAQVSSAVALLDGGATVPFIARYRKEATDGLDDIQLRELESRLGYLREMQSRREAIVQSITEQGKLTNLALTNRVAWAGPSRLTQTGQRRQPAHRPWRRLSPSCRA